MSVPVRGALHEAVVRAIAELPVADVSWRPDWDEAASAAVGVVLAEAKRSIEALDWHIAGEGPPEDEPLLIDSIRSIGCPRGAGGSGVTRYRTIVADPPWQIPFGTNRTPPSVERPGKWSENAATTPVRDLPYQTMTLAAIAELPMADLAEPDAHLYVWTVNRYIAQTYELVAGWGFRPAQLLTWCKAPMGLGLGGAFTPTTEHVLFCRRGTLKASARLDSTWWQWKRGEHSAKPEAFMDLVEQVSPGPYLEMFSRRARLGWDTWGDESLHGGVAA